MKPGNLPVVLGKVPKGVESCGSRRAKDERSGAKGKIALYGPAPLVAGAPRRTRSGDRRV